MSAPIKAPMRLLLPLLAACTAELEPEDTELPTLVFAPPSQTPEVGEVSTYGVLLPGDLPDRVEWSVDGELFEFGAPTGTDRSDVDLEAPSEAFVIEVEAYYGFEPVVATLDMTAVPNTPPVLTIVEPTATSVTAGTAVALAAMVEDRTAPPTACVWEVGDAILHEGEAENGAFNRGWAAVSGTWSLRVACTDKLGATGEAQLTLDVP